MTKRKKEATSQIQKEETKTLQFIVGGVVILAIALLALLFYKSQPSSPTTAPAEDPVVAQVNNQVILQSQLDQQYSRLPAQFRQILTRPQVLDQMIDESLLLQKAKELGIQITDDEIQKRLGEFLKQNNVDQKVFDESLQRQGLSTEDVNDLFQKQLTIQALLDKQFGTETKVTDKEIVDYFNENIQDYHIPPSTKVRHILIAFGNLTEKETEEKAREIRDLIKPDFSNFCQLVQDYSADRASIRNCGEYTYTEDTQFVPEFKELGEKQGLNQIGQVKTQFGYHILQTLAKLPERLPKLQDVRGDIQSILQAKKQRATLQKYIQELRQKSLIENKLTNQTTEPTAGKQAEKRTETKTQPAPKGENTPTEGKTDLHRLALCLSKKATLYGTKTDAETRKQLDFFGDASQYLPFIDCSYLGNPNVLKKECVQKGATKFPTWIINGMKEEGVQQPEKLAGIAGC